MDSKPDQTPIKKPGHFVSEAMKKPPRMCHCGARDIRYCTFDKPPEECIYD